MSSVSTGLPGQETLLASWAALALASSGARLIRSPEAAAAVFPAWAPLNNAIVSTASPHAPEPAVISTLRDVYVEAGVGTWALWIPSRATDLNASDDLRALDGFTRDTTTLVMRTDLRPGPARHDGVMRASIAAATRAGDEPVPVADLGEPEAIPGLAAWVLVREGFAIASAWTFRHGDDCGIYAVGTVPAWRRRGLATALLRHVLATAERNGARTATLQSTQMAQSLYESLGFVTVGRYEEWVSR
ncbi:MULTISPECIES: N-acetyltransferase [unclassified Pseudofrankia]|uniref:GNAT family N-acetyltransferase n=1 Tax=unclassified Pseudofrankia TaxID=2994372 RepID=UPI000A77E95D|nr:MULTISPECIES: GNAT family N-acetyltransferase [unclassified Pseudofrankia]MDT3439772.1 GNAT family N-acetyltransferase [Pseudofrankia sp. BMG5.37]